MSIGRTNTGGGGSTFKAILRITSEEGAVVTATSTSSGKTKTYSGVVPAAGVVDIDIKTAGVYSIYATKNGEVSPSISIIIIENGEIYTGELQFKTYLYRADSAETGYENWSVLKKNPVGVDGNNAPRKSQNAENALVGTWGSGISGWLYYNTKIDLTDYNQLILNGLFSGVTPGSTSRYYKAIGLLTATNGANLNTNLTVLSWANIDNAEAVLDISNYDGEYYVCVSGYTTNITDFAMSEIALRK